jgi:2-oxoglutarate dehydrogenase complex dehydrogenase (E1) component-like enzyme
MFTQPIMYSIIKKHKNVLDKYSDQLVAEGVCTKEEVEGVVANYEQVNNWFGLNMRGLKLLGEKCVDQKWYGQKWVDQKWFGQRRRG